MIHYNAPKFEFNSTAGLNSSSPVRLTRVMGTARVTVTNLPTHSVSLPRTSIKSTGVKGRVDYRMNRVILSFVSQRGMSVFMSSEINGNTVLECHFIYTFFL